MKVGKQHINEKLLILIITYVIIGNTMTNNSITIRLAPKDIEQIDNTIEAGYFTSRSDMIRTSLRHYIAELKSLPPIIEEMSQKADKKSITKEKIVKAARKARKQVYKEEYENV